MSINIVLFNPGLAANYCWLCLRWKKNKEYTQLCYTVLCWSLLRTPTASIAILAKSPSFCRMVPKF